MPRPPAPGTNSGLEKLAMKAAMIPMRSIPVVVQLLVVVSALCTDVVMRFEIPMRPPPALKLPVGNRKLFVPDQPTDVPPSPTA